MAVDKETKIIAILNEIEEISSFLAAQYDSSDGDALTDLLGMVNGYLARLPKLEAEAEYLKGYKKGEVAQDKGEKHTATVFREVLAGEIALYEKVYKFVYRLNQNLIEYQKGVVSQLSYVKASMPHQMNHDLLAKLDKLHDDVKELKKWREGLL